MRLRKDTACIFFQAGHSVNSMESALVIFEASFLSVSHITAGERVQYIPHALEDNVMILERFMYSYML